MLIKKKDANPLDKKVVDNIRGLGIDMISEAGSGHPGIVLGAAPIIATLYQNHLKIDTNNPNWINRDRFVMSAGHGSALLYATLHMAGYNITLDDLKKFRKLDSITPGHPELITPGVDCATGPLGQGIANAVGMAIGEKYLSSLLKDGVIDFNTYALCGDGDLMEGISYEALSLAGKLKLNKLILLYDSNGISLDGDTNTTFTDNIKLRFESIGWNVITVSDPEDLTLVNDAFIKAKTSDLPTIIEFKTTIGKYSRLEGTKAVHGSILDSEDVKEIKEKLGLRDIPFQISSEASTYFSENITTRCNAEIEEWMGRISSLSEEEKEILNELDNSKKSVKLKDLYYDIPDDNYEATRVTSGKILNAIAKSYKLLIGGSADVASSTYAKLNDYEDRTINFGVREHAMGGIANGLALVGLTPFVSTFLSFSDYLKPAIRMSAMMNLPVIYVFTHDSITVGEDGPTHQPVEQLISLRSIPNLNVYRPIDANEVLGSYKSIFDTREPSVIVLSRNKVNILDSTKVGEVKNGAYILKEELKRLDAILISSGEDAELTLEVANLLTEKGIDTRVVSMPSIERFKKMGKEYIDNILPDKSKTFVIEASSPYSWYQFVSDESHLFTMNTFGSSGNYKDVLNKYNFDAKYIENKIEELLK